MEFTHRPYVPNEVIAAIATPLGEGGIAIIRISGKGSFQVASKIFSKNLERCESHTAHFGSIYSDLKEKVDEGLALVMKGPRSFTGEDTVELQCHGGMIAAKKVLEATLNSGARAAHPGEFSFRAFMNGKIDLAQAEAIQSLIAAKNEKAHNLSCHYLEGSLSKKIAAFQEELVALTAIFEAWVDFPEEGLEFATPDEIKKRLESVVEAISTLLSTFSDGKKIAHGLSLCLVGAPNVGKSSLMNALLDRERAIVTPMAGTTRDVLEEDLKINGIHFRLIDTAGIRVSHDPIEQEGIRRSKEALKAADLVLWVIDVTQEMSVDEKELLSTIAEEKTVVVWNKCDLPQHKKSHSFRYETLLSAKEKMGLETLKSKIDEVIWRAGAPSQEEILLSSERHAQALTKANILLKKVLQELSGGASPEFLVADLKGALYELGTIIGKNVSEEVLSSIFSQFCIGK